MITTLDGRAAPQDMQEHIAEILLTAEQIDQRVHELGAQISADYAPMVARGEPILLVGLLKGVVIFMADLLRTLTIPVEVDFMDMTHYAHERQNGGVIDLDRHLPYSIEGCHVLFVEEIVDKGLTLSHLLRNLRLRHPASLRVCTLFDKPTRRLIELPIDYTGFVLPDVFVVGYGLDCRQKFRNLPYLGRLRPEVMRQTTWEPVVH